MNMITENTLRLRRMAHNRQRKEHKKTLYRGKEQGTYIVNTAPESPLRLERKSWWDKFWEWLFE